MSFFDHPLWPLLIFGFFIAPRILLFSLWLPVRSNLGEVISHPILSYIGFFIVPRLVLACLCTGYFWTTNPVLCVSSFFFSFAGDSTEKVFYRKVFYRRYRFK